MRRALSVDENQTHLIFASQLHGNPRPFRDALIFPRFKRTRRDDEMNFVVKFPFQSRLLKNKYKHTPKLVDKYRNIEPY